jgi:hypothetical protein
MSYPSQRDRIVEYEAIWQESPHSALSTMMLTLTQDLSDSQKEIGVVAFINTKVREVNLWDSLKFQATVSQLGLVVRPERVRSFYESDITHNILNLGAPGLRLDSPQETVRFMNRFAALFHYPPAASTEFRRKVLRSEVRVRFMSNKLRWMDEAEWLAASASLESQAVLEDQFVQACGALRREGDVIRITLNRAFSEQAAASLNGTYGIAFVFSQEVRNALREVGRDGYAPKPLTITLEYRTRITTGARQVARILAPYLEGVQSAISAE